MRRVSFMMIAFIGLSSLAACNQYPSGNIDVLGGFRSRTYPGHFFEDNPPRPVVVPFEYVAPGPGECKHKKVATIKGPIRLVADDGSKRGIRTYSNISFVLTSSATEVVCKGENAPETSFSGGFHSRGGKVIVAGPAGSGQPKAVKIDFLRTGGRPRVVFDGTYPSVHTCHGERGVDFEDVAINQSLFSTVDRLRFSVYGGHFVWC